MMQGSKFQIDVQKKPVKLSTKDLTPFNISICLIVSPRPVHYSAVVSEFDLACNLKDHSVKPAQGRGSRMNKEHVSKGDEKSRGVIGRRVGMMQGATFNLTDRQSR